MPKKYDNIRIVEVDGSLLLGASGYRIFTMDESGSSKYVAKIDDPVHAFLSKFSRTRRMFRAEVHRLLTLSNGNRICIARKGIFLQEKDSKHFVKTFRVPRGSRPMNICEDSDGAIYFGEYYPNPERGEVHVYGSFDGCHTWQIVYTFGAGTIRHIHGIYKDPWSGKLWITTGDENGECLIAFTDDRFRTVTIAAGGDQRYRTCTLLFLEDRIIYGTDSPCRINSIYSMSRKDYALTELKRVQGSVINSCMTGDHLFVSTTVEPSEVNTDRDSYLWYSYKGLEWKIIARYKKDKLNINLFQFGNIRFPHYRNTPASALYFSGHALEEIDGCTVEIDFNELSENR